MDSGLIDQVRQRYSLIAREAIQREFSQLTVLGACCGTSADDGSCCSTDVGDHVHHDPEADKPILGAGLYPPSLLATIPAISAAVSSGCGSPTEDADLKPGEVVADLGCGGGIDVFLAARLVGERGRVYGVEMTEQMLALANSCKRAAKLANAEFIFGYMEELPLPSGSVDVAMSNCALNMSSDKPAAFAELGRIVKSGGRLAMCDVVASDELPAEQRALELNGLVVAGAMTFGQYAAGLGDAGFEGVKVRPTHEVAPQIYAASVTATRA